MYAQFAQKKIPLPTHTKVKAKVKVKPLALLEPYPPGTRLRVLQSGYEFVTTGSMPTLDDLIYLQGSWFYSPAAYFSNQVEVVR